MGKPNPRHLARKSGVEGRRVPAYNLSNRPSQAQPDPNLKPRAPNPRKGKRGRSKLDEAARAALADIDSVSLTPDDHASIAQLDDDAAKVPIVRLHARHRAFLELFRQYGYKDEDSAAKAAGFPRSTAGRELVVRLQHLIVRMKLNDRVGTQVEVDEALEELAKLVRSDDDPKTKLAAIRTVLEANHVFSKGGLPPDTRRALIQQMADLAASIKLKLGGASVESALKRLELGGVTSATTVFALDEALIKGETLK